MAVVVIIEDHSLMADSLAVALGAEGFTVFIAALTTRAAVLDFAAQQRPDVVLLDLDLGDDFGRSFDLIKPLAAQGARVLIVSATPERMHFAIALEQGAAGFLAKGRPLAELVAAVHSASSGATVLATGERHALLHQLRQARRTRTRELEPFARLTPREQVVLRGLLDGRRADELAKATMVSPATIRTHLRGVLTKLGVSSQLAAVAAAKRAGWPLSDWPN